ncbi:MAG: response regulator [Deltaproteobacteria bacterium]|nr:MAG: response regulator [Deltaproteobacteria bacterium]
MSLTGLKIAVVDDEEMIRTLIGEILEEEGASVELFEGGNSAFEYLKNNQVSWVISDINMPDGNGLELVKKIREMDRLNKPQILLLCGMADEILSPRELGIKKIFKKPDEVEEIIDYILENT